MLIGSAALKPTLASGLHPVSREQARMALKDACEEFEAILAKQVVEAARRAAATEGLFGDEAASSMVEDVHDGFLSAALGQSKSPGLAEMLFDDLIHQVETTCVSEGAVASQPTEGGAA